MKITAQIQHTSFISPLGRMVLASADEQLIGVWFEDQAHLPDLGQARHDPQHPVLMQAIAQLNQYFAGQRSSFELPLDMSTGTLFQQTVWQALLDIPAGATCSYGLLASRIGQPKAVRAVGAAVGRNPLSIVVPCHRVIGANGSLTGYAGGMARKSALLQLEGAV